MGRVLGCRVRKGSDVPQALSFWSREVPTSTAAFAHVLNRTVYVRFTLNDTQPESSLQKESVQQLPPLTYTAYCRLWSAPRACKEQRTYSSTGLSADVLAGSCCRMNMLECING